MIEILILFIQVCLMDEVSGLDGEMLSAAEPRHPANSVQGKLNSWNKLGAKLDHLSWRRSHYSEQIKVGRVIEKARG